MQEGLLAVATWARSLGDRRVGGHGRTPRTWKRALPTGNNGHERNRQPRQRERLDSYPLSADARLLSGAAGGIDHLLDDGIYDEKPDQISDDNRHAPGRRRQHLAGIVLTLDMEWGRVSVGVRSHFDNSLGEPVVNGLVLSRECHRHE